MKIYHYHSSYGAKNLHEMISDFGLSATDKSFFRPDVSSVRAKLGSLVAQGNGKVGVYDFDDGKDTGDVLMTFLRNKALDQTEIDNAFERIKANAERLRQEDVDKFIDSNKDKDSKELRDSLKQFLTRDSAVDVVSSSQGQNNPKTS